MMNRREAISRVALIMGGTMIGAEFFLSGCAPRGEKASELYDKAHVALLDEVGDTIIPKTNTPGAKAVGIGSFIAMMVNECYNERDQQVFVAGITKLNDASKDTFSKTFVECSPAERTTVLTALDKEQKDYAKYKGKDDPNHYFRMMKELTILGYFTSKEGCTEALRYEPVPGRYDGNFPYKKGDKAWAT